MGMDKVGKESHTIVVIYCSPNIPMLQSREPGFFLVEPSLKSQLHDKKLTSFAD